MGGARLLAVLLILLLLAQGALATEDCFYQNLCDEGFGVRASAATGWLTTYYVERNTLLQDVEESYPLRYPAALFFLSTANPADATTANQFLAQQATYDKAATDLAPIDALYLAWILKGFGDELTAENKAHYQPLLNGFTIPSGVAEDEEFLGLVVSYLGDGEEEALTVFLQERGKEGWDASASPERLAEVVVGLSALYAQAPDTEVRTLAEMHLDLLFARFAATQAGGVWGTLRADGDAAAAYRPTLTPWYGWSYLLLDTSNNQHRFTEPGLLLSGYCAHTAIRRLAEWREKPNNALEATERLGEAYSYAYATPSYVMGGAVDVTDHRFAPDAFVTKAAVRFTDDPYAVIEASSRTGADSPAGDVFATKGLLLGSLGSDSCAEPHILLESVEHDFDANHPDFLLLSKGDEYFALRTLSYPTDTPVAERYAPLAAQMEYGYGEEKGTAILLDPEQGGSFALEAVPKSVITKCSEDNLELIPCIAPLTSFERGEDGTLTYTTKIGRRQEATYAYTPGSAAKKGGSPLAFDGYAYGLVSQLNTQNLFRFLENDRGRWTIKSGLANTLSLDFPGDMKSEANDYGCRETEDLTASDERSDEEWLAYLAASLQPDSGDYVLSCGPPEQVLPNHATMTDDQARYACVLAEGTTRVVGLIPTDGSFGPLLTDLERYYPFTSSLGGSDAVDVPATLCDTAYTGNEESSDFNKCDSVTAKGKTTSVYLSPARGILIISNVNDPFAVGIIDSLLAWFRGIFGDIVEEGAETEGSFAQAYFARTGEKEVAATLSGNHAELLFTGLGESVSSLASLFGETGSLYRVGGERQLVATDVADSASWQAATARLRLSAGGDAEDFGGSCGDAILNIGEECDPGVGNLPACADDTAKRPTCRSSGEEACTIDASPCAPACPDLDEDGYSSGGSSCEKNGDCYDADPATVQYFAGSGFASCVGVSGEQCRTAPTSTCPQCIHPGQDEGVCDGKDNNCVGGIDEGCAETPTGGGTSEESCAAEAVDDCAYVCVASFPAGPTTCPTEWAVAETQGEYTFSVRISDDGWPELKVTPSNRNVEGVTCNLRASGSDTDAPLTILWGASGDSAIFSNGGERDAKVTATMVENGWKIDYNDGGSEAAQTCWGTSGTKTLFTIDPFASVHCLYADSRCVAEDGSTPSCGTTCVALDDETLLHCGDAPLLSGGGGDPFILRPKILDDGTGTNP